MRGHGATVVWDFEGNINVENNPVEDRLYDQGGVLKFNLVAAGGDTFDFASEGTPSNPVQYTAVNDQSSITSTPGGGPNSWFLRSDWNFNGASHNKHGDGDVGEFVSDTFTIDDTSSFTMDVGGGSAPNGFFLHDAETDNIILSEHRGGGFLEQRAWTNTELTNAGVSGPTEVYLRISDSTTGGWGNVAVDNIVAQNVTFPQIPEITSFTSDAQVIAAGSPVTLSWTVVDPLSATPSVAIVPEVGDVTGTSSIVVNPTVTTTYSLTTENANGSASAELTITVDEAPTISSFTPGSSSIRAGESTSLSWVVSGAASLSIDGGVGGVTGANSIPVSPTVTTTYTLTATNAVGSTTAQATVTVDLSPLITTFESDQININSGTPITLSWNVANADSLDIDQGVGDVTGLASAVDSPSSTLTYTLTATNAFGSSTATVSVIVDETLTISEFLAVNDGTLLDEDGDASDWIEIHNNTGATISLDGWHLTDNAGTLAKWTFPAVDLAAGEYLIVFASSKDRAVAGSELHTNFKLSGGGEYLALVKPDGVTITRHYSPAYPGQEADVSYGLFGGALNEGFFDPPTPGIANATGFDGFVADTTFSHDRGFYDAPFAVAIASTTPNAQIRYTTDGTPPSDTAGTLYTTPVPVSSTTTLRAIAFRSGFRSTDIDTQTYLFTADIKNQPDMDQDVLGVAPYSATIEDDLKSIPTMSLVLPDSSLFGSSGIYSNPQGRGIAWERAVSIEFFSADGSEELQIDGGVRMHGADARSHQKKPFRLYFRSEYGAGKLRFPLYPGVVSEFDKLVLRGGGHEGWTSPYGSGVNAQAHSATYLRDQFLRQTHGEMGNLSPRGRPIHLYLNGTYWGLYNVHERVDGDFGEAHFGGVDDDYDVVKTDGAVVDGTKTDWSSMQTLANGGLTDDLSYAQMLDYVDLDSFIDSMIVRIWSGDIDWLRSSNTLGETGNRNKNWYCLRKTRGTDVGKWQFFIWDGELSMGKGHRSNRNLNFDLSDVDISDSPGRIYDRLRDNADFRLRFADRLQKHFFNDGPMTSANNQARWNALADDVRAAVVGESARWGDATRGAPYTRDEEWESEVDWMADTFMAGRTATVLSQFAAIDLYPDTAPAVFTPQHGGAIGAAPVGFTNPPSGTIYYTTDGSDPRASTAGAGESLLVAEGTSGVGIAPSVANGGAALSIAQWTGIADPSNIAQWKTGTTGLGFENTPDSYDPFIGIHVPEMRNQTASAYLRVPFTVADQATLDSIATLTLRMRYDDGFVAYINGSQVEAVAEPLVLDWQAGATSSHPDSLALSPVSFDITVHKSALQVGTNILAIHALNRGAGSSDMLALPELAYTTAAASGISPTALAYSTDFTLPASANVRARVFDGGEWSALSEATFLVGTLADATNTVVSELNYNPPGASEDLEFIELANISTGPVDYSGVSFGAGLDFSVPVGTVAPAGGYVLIVANQVAFETAYGAGLPVAGEFANSTSLDNGGEAISLLASDGSLIESFTYDDDAPWPTAPDGVGQSLTRIMTTPSNDPSAPTSWRSSVTANGSPGSSDASQFIGDPEADLDSDGLPALAEHAFGTSDTAHTNLDEFFTLGRSGDTITIGLELNLAAEGVETIIQHSEDLVTWSPAAPDLESVSFTDNGDGTATFQFADATASEAREFWRVLVSSISP